LLLPPERKDEWSNYRVVSVLGEGSYGKVYKVKRIFARAQLNEDILTPKNAG